MGLVWVCYRLHLWMGLFLTCSMLVRRFRHLTLDCKLLISSVSKRWQQQDQRHVSFLVSRLYQTWKSLSFIQTSSVDLYLLLLIKVVLVFLSCGYLRYLTIVLLEACQQITFFELESIITHGEWKCGYIYIWNFLLVIMGWEKGEHIHVHPSTLFS